MFLSIKSPCFSFSFPPYTRASHAHTEMFGRCVPLLHARAHGRAGVLRGGFDEIRPRGISSGIKGCCVAERRGRHESFISRRKEKGRERKKRRPHCAWPTVPRAINKDFHLIAIFDRPNARARASLPRPEEFLLTTTAAAAT